MRLGPAITADPCTSSPPTRNTIGHSSRGGGGREPWIGLKCRAGSSQGPAQSRPAAQRSAAAAPSRPGPQPLSGGHGDPAGGGAPRDARTAAPRWPLRRPGPIVGTWAPASSTRASARTLRGCCAAATSSARISTSWQIWASACRNAGTNGKAARNAAAPSSGRSCRSPRCARSWARTACSWARIEQPLGGSGVDDQTASAGKAVHQRPGVRHRHQGRPARGGQAARSADVGGGGTDAPAATSGAEPAPGGR